MREILQCVQLPRHRIKDISLKGDTLYLNSDKEVFIFNISNPVNPVLTIKHDIEGNISSVFAGDDNNIYIAAGSDGLKVLMTGDQEKDTNIQMGK